MNSIIQKQSTLTYDDVANLCDSLVELNHKPTQQILSNILQRGSTTTINKHFKKWKESQIVKGVKLSKSIIRSIETEIDSMVQTESREFNSKIIELQNEIKSKDAKLRSLELKNEELEKELSVLKKESELKNNEIEAERLLLAQEKKKTQNLLVHEKELEMNIVLLSNKDEINTSLIKELKSDKKELEKQKDAILQENTKLQVKLASIGKAK